MRAGHRYLLKRVVLAALALQAGTVETLWGADRAPAEPKSARDDRYFESVDVAVTNVEVFVTDRSGKPALGLTRDDFEVLEDGKRMEITNFFAQQEAMAANAGAAAGAPGRSVPEAPAADAPAPERTLAVFLDNRNLEANSRKWVLESLEKVVAGLDPRDRFVLVTYGRSTSMRILAAADRAAILEALRRGVATGGDSRSDLELLQARLQEASGDSRSAPIARVAEEDLILWANQRYQQVLETIAALESAVDALAGLPGHKALLYITSDLPLRPLEGILERSMAEDKAAPPIPFLDATVPLQRVIDRANAGRVTLYGLGIPKEGRSGFDPSATPKLGALINMAAGSGGQFSLDPSDAARLPRQVVADLATFYSLGYAPPPGKAGKLRHLAVRVTKPGLSVRFREGYRTKTGVEIALDRTKTALFLGEVSNPLGLAIEFGQAVPDGKGNLSVEVTVRFPLDRITLLPAGGEHQGKLVLFLGARGSQGNVSPLTPIAIPLHIPDARLAEASRQLGGYRTRLLLRPEPCQVVVGLRDELGNSDSTLLAEWQPPAGVIPGR